MSQTNNEKAFISNEIATYMTNNRLLAFSDRLNPASLENYAGIHAKGEKGEDGRKVYSTIGILASDFTKGKGANNIKAEANISPAEARFIFHWVQIGLGTLNGTILKTTKIFGQPDAQGYAPVRNLSIWRASKDNEGKDRGAPWAISIENGVGIKASNAAGGFYCKPKSFRSERAVTVYCSDQDFFSLMSQVVAYINVWENAYGPKLIREGRLALEQARAEYAAEKAHNPQDSYPAHHNQDAPHGYNGHGAAPAPPPVSQGAYPQSTPQPQVHNNAPPQGHGTTMTLDQARAVVIPFGKSAGKTFGQLESSNPGGLDWYANTYTGTNEELRLGARVILANLPPLQKAS